MSKLVAQQSRQFGLILQRQENSPRGGDTAARKGIGVDIGGVHALERVRHLRSMRDGSHFFARLLKVAVQFSVLRYTVIGGVLMWRMLFVDLDLRVFRYEHQLFFARHRVDGAADDESRGRKAGKPQKITAVQGMGGG